MSAKQLRKADQYNSYGDSAHKTDYRQYWQGREYENDAEEIAIRTLLRGQHFARAVDVGGGFGRLSVLLTQFADKVTLAEPSKAQLDIAADFLKDYPQIERKLLQAGDLQLPDGTVDLVIMVRVMHHLPDPAPELAEIYRVLAPGGTAIIEMANYAHIRNRIKHALRGKKLPVAPVDIRPGDRRGEDFIPFVNHNPATLAKQLRDAGFTVVRTLSVSNLRSTTLKKIVPRRVLLTAEKLLQKPLAHVTFGPSIFFLVRKPR